MDLTVKSEQPSEDDREKLAELIRKELIPREKAEEEARLMKSDALAQRIEKGFNMNPISTHIQMKAYIAEAKRRLAARGVEG